MLGRDKLCAVVAAPDARSMRRQLVRALRETSTVELRLDWLSSDAEITHFLGQLAPIRRKATVIATCRRNEAGGRYRGSIAKQLVHLAEAIRAGCIWYDLEIETVRQCPPELVDVLLGDGRQLTSAHFFRGMPANLSRVALELRRDRPDAVKIAAQCDSLADSRKLLDFAQKQRNVVAVPMGDVALPARFLALREKRAFAYAPVENATAPGQITLEEMKHIYRADEFDGRTRVYGVIGNPIGHSLSPAMQNAGFAARRMNAVYLPFLVRDLKDFLDSVGPLGIRGFSVTLPHKERIIGRLDGCDPLAARNRSREHGRGARRRETLRVQHGLRRRAAFSRAAHASARQPRADRRSRWGRSRRSIRAGASGSRRLRHVHGGTRERNRWREPSAAKPSQGPGCGANSSTPS